MLADLDVRFQRSLQHGRSRFRAQPQRVRWAIWAGLEAVIALVVGLAVDASLGIAIATIVALVWLPKLRPMPDRLVAEIAIVLFYILLASVSENNLWVPVVGFIVAFAISWLPDEPRPIANGRWRPKPRSAAIPLTMLAVAILYPYYVSHLFTIPLFGQFPTVNTGVVMLVFIMMALGLNIVVGYAGLLDLGYVAFYAMGAYTAAWFASLQFPTHTVHFGDVGINPDLPGFHISVWLLLVVAGLVTAFVGIVIGLPTLRLRGDYLAIVTLGFGEIMPQIARNGDQLFGTNFNLTNGPNGITPIDQPGFGETISNATGGFLPAAFSQATNSDNLYYWTALALVLVTVFCSWRLRDSRLGRAWIAIREDETAAAAMGVPLMRTKTWAYATGAFFGGVAGAFYASFKTATFPGDFFFNISVSILCMVILGGMGNIWGVIAGAALLEYLDQAGLANTGAWLNTHLSLNIDVPKYEFGIFGVILLVVMLFRPEGLIPSSRRKAEFHEGVHDEPLYDVQA